jgi:hypothetical protein
MTDYQLLQSFSNLIQNCGPSSYDDYGIFNNNTNITLKTDYMSYAFSIQDQYNLNTNCNGNIQNNFMFQYPYFIFNSLVLVINLLQYCIFANLPNSFKYVINNKTVKLLDDYYNSLMDDCNGFKREYICSLISMANILDKYNFKPNLNYNHNTIHNIPNGVPISYVYVIN